MNNPNLAVVILAGGVGSRLWPLSSNILPKQFITLDGNSSLFGRTLKRACELSDYVFVVTNNDYLELVMTECSRQSVDIKVICEPCSRNTCGSVMFVLGHIAKHYAELNQFIVMPSDHYISDNSFIDQVNRSIDLNQLILFGCMPNSPHTGYGYIEFELTDFPLQNVTKFHEKPTLSSAKKYLKEGNYLWNTGMILGGVDLFHRMANHICTDIMKMVSELLDFSSSNYPLLISDKYKNLPNVSIDSEFLQKVHGIKVIKADFEWSDLGTWDSLIQNRDLLGLTFNQIEGDNLIYSNKMTNIRLEGLDHAFIALTDEGLLIRREQSKVDSTSMSQVIERPWGTYEVLLEGPFFKIKKIVMNPRSSISLQYHNHRSEHWIVVQGQVSVQLNNDFFVLNQNQSTYIPLSSLHRLTNESNDFAVIIEVQCGQYLGEDDIVRVEDIYGRVK